MLGFPEVVELACAVAVALAVGVMIITWVWSLRKSELFVEWGKFLLAFALVAGASYLATKYAILGGITNQVVGLLVLGGLAGWAEKIRRSNANVRYRVGKVMETGDGGSDYYSVMLRIMQTSFLRKPYSYFREPFPCLELTIPQAGLNAGSVRLNTRPVSNAEKGVRVFTPGNAEAAPTDNAQRTLTKLRKRGAMIPVKITKCIKHGLNYSDLSEDQQSKITRNEFYTWMGLEIMERDGIKFPHTTS